MADLAERLEADADVEEWVIRGFDRRVVSRVLGGAGLDEERRHRGFEITVFVDREQTRGEASFVVGPGDDAAVGPSLAAAVARAKLDRGPLWRLPRPAAPARVELADAALLEDPAAAAARAAADLAAADRRARVGRGRIDVEAARFRLLSSAGFDRDYAATRVEATATLIAGSRRLRVAAPFAARARRSTDLDLAARLEAATARLLARSGADPTPLGRHDLVIDAVALEALGLERGWLAPLAAQASGARARRSLSRYQPGQSVYGQAPVSGDPLTLLSDGAIDFALASAPFGDFGEPVRRFALIERGRAAGLALDAREAALRGRRPNGGLRNLVVGPGERSRAQLASGERPILEITELAWLDTEPASGHIAAEIALAYRHEGDGRRRSVRGGQIAGNLFDWLPRMRFSAAAVSLPGYVGPRWLGWPNIEIR